MGNSLGKALGPRRASTQAGHNRVRRLNSVIVHKEIW